MYKLKELQKQLHQELLTQIAPPEVEQIVMWLLEYYLRIQRTDILLNKRVTVSQKVQHQLRKAVDRLNRQEPIQYVLGEAYFYGRRFNVAPSVLIPRRETEELVAWVKEKNPQERLRVLDVGTGSGCIAVTLSVDMNRPKVHALDVSEAAIQIATDNAALYQAPVTFWTGNLLREGLTVPTPFDVVVSNPPYVRRSEASAMSPSVLEHEPDIALFVKNERPLLFYERMAYLCRYEGWLATSGMIYWEINEVMSHKIVQLLQNHGFQGIVVRDDMQGKPRFVTGKLAE